MDSHVDKHGVRIEMALDALISIAAMDATGARADDLGRAAGIARMAIATLQCSVNEAVEPFVFEPYPYNGHAMGCGLEDRDITDRYEAMAYGWERAMERAAEAIPDDLYPASAVVGLCAQNVMLKRILRRFVDFHTKPAGLTVDIITDKEKFAKAMDVINGSQKELVAEAISVPSL